MNIPSNIRKGDSIVWRDLPTRDNLGNSIAPPDWTLKYAIRGKTQLDVTAVNDSGQWKSTISKTETSDLEVGQYYWQAFAEKDSERITLSSGQIEVLPNLVDIDSQFDGRSQARKDLEAVQTAIRSMIAGGAVAEYTIGNRSLRKLPMADLLTIESKLKYDVAQEEKSQKIANGLGNPNNMFVRFR